MLSHSRVVSLEGAVYSNYNFLQAYIFYLNGHEEIILFCYALKWVKTLMKVQNSSATI